MLFALWQNVLVKFRIQMCTLKYLHMKLMVAEFALNYQGEKPKSWLKKVQLNIYL